MNFLEKILYFLQGEMDRPTMYGWYHILWIVITIGFIIFFYLRRDKNNEKTLKIVLLVYGIGALILELLKQIVWSFNYDATLNLVTWDYNWYAAPFQLCTTPIYACLLAAFLKKGRARDSLLSFMAYFTILGSLSTFFYPESVFVRTILVNIHTMYLHCGSLVVSIYLLINKEVSIDRKSLFNGYKIFLLFAFIAEVLNIGIYKSGILHGETFNMFYISPYFISELPIFNTIQTSVPFIVFLFLYLLAIFLGGVIIYLLAKAINYIHKKIKN